jgi:quercetin dioxygenase-like cupin family protein
VVGDRLFQPTEEKPALDIDVPLRELGAVRIDELCEAVLTLPREAWLANQKRQQDYDVHSRTESVVLIFTDGSGWPDITLTRESGWDALSETAVPLMTDIVRRHYKPGGTIIRAMAAKLLPGEVITPHRDSHPSFHHGHRIHIPLKTNPRVRFMIDGKPYKLKVGEAYEINNQKTHSVMNKGSEERINFIFDYVPPELVGAAS